MDKDIDKLGDISFFDIQSNDSLFDIIQEQREKIDEIIEVINQRKQE